MARAILYLERIMRQTKSSMFFAAVLCLGGTVAVPAATIAPPMLDVARQCNAMARKNTTMMSECIVAESEARADLLQHWDRLPDASVERCIKLGAKAKRQPYVLMEKCLSADLSAAAMAPRKP